MNDERLIVVVVAVCVLSAQELAFSVFNSDLPFKLCLLSSVLSHIVSKHFSSEHVVTKRISRDEIDIQVSLTFSRRVCVWLALWLNANIPTQNRLTIVRRRALLQILLRNPSTLLLFHMLTVVLYTYTQAERKRVMEHSKPHCGACFFRKSLLTMSFNCMDWF